MPRRALFPLLMGVVGVAVLLALGAWQLRRLEWKNAIVAEIDARLVAAPVATAAAVNGSDQPANLQPDTTGAPTQVQGPDEAQVRGGAPSTSGADEPGGRADTGGADGADAPGGRDD